MNYFLQSSRSSRTSFRRLVGVLGTLGFLFGTICANSRPTAAAEPVPKGVVRVASFGDVKIHTYVSPADGWLVNSQIIEGPTTLVIFDGQLLLPYAEEVANYADRLGKPVERIIVSHGHPDHWAGLQVISERFPSAHLMALPGVADGIKSRGEPVLAAMRKILGDRIASKVTVPSEPVTEGRQVIDGVTYDFRSFKDAESDLQLVAFLPKQRVLLAFDLVFSPRDHLFVVGPNFDHWIETIDALQTIGDYDTILGGHDGPINRTAFAATESYLRKAKEAYVSSRERDAYVAALKDAFPEREQSGWLEFSSRLLYSRPRP